MIVPRKKLCDLISEICPGEYVIGLHGINELIANDTIGNTKKKILDEGLIVQSGNTINGTVMFFGRIDLESDKKTLESGLNYYSHGNKELIIVAIPTIFRNSNGEELYLGATNLDSIYKNYMNTSGHEITTLLDYVVLEKSENLKRVVPKEFILALGKLLDDDNIDLEVNEDHISFKNGIISDEKFERTKKIINQFLKIYGLSSNIMRKGLTPEEIQTLKRKKEELEFRLQTESQENAYLGYDMVCILETITQLLNEEKTKDKIL